MVRQEPSHKTFFDQQEVSNTDLELIIFLFDKSTAFLSRTSSNIWIELGYKKHIKQNLGLKGPYKVPLR